MAKDVRRSLPRVSYEQRIRLLGDDGKPLIVGRTTNLSPSGIYVRAPNGCEIGSEVICDLPLPGGTRQLRGRVTRTEAHADDSTGIGIQFVELTTGDSSSLHRVLEGGAPRPVAVKVMFEGMDKPIKCHGTVTADGIRLSTSLPFLRLGSGVQAVYDGHDAKVDARGVLTGVRLEPVGGDGVPRLGVHVDVESERPFDPSVARTPELSREDSSVGGAFTAWEGLPAGAARRREPAVVAELGAETEPHEVTAVRRRPARRGLAARMAALSGWAFVAVAMGTFGFVYLAITRLGPGIDESRRPEIAGSVAVAAAAPRPAPAARMRPPVVVPSTISRSVPPPVPTTSSADGRGLAGTVEAPNHGGASTFTSGAAAAGSAGAPAASPRAGAHGRLRPRPLLDTAPEEKSARSSGIDVAVESGVLYHEVTLAQPEADGRFGVKVTPSWPTTFAIVGKSPAGFTVSFGTPAPANAHLDWFLVR